MLGQCGVRAGIDSIGFDIDFQQGYYALVLNLFYIYISLTNLPFN